MKNTLLIFLCISLCLQCSHRPIEQSTKNKAIKQQEVADHFYLQRSWPDKNLDIRAYTAAIYQAKAQMAEKGHLPGFDRPWTSRGPANIGARINTIAVHPLNHDIIYAGFSTGGLFKTTNGGQDWQAIFDEQAFLSIGDIAIDPSDPSTIYVGTGDPNISGYPFIGDGVYKSEDGGSTWAHLGLADERIVSKIIVDPHQASTIYVGCMGLPFERNDERGLYKSMDGGQTWSQVLFSSNQSGIIDMVMDPFDSNTLYAASWDRIRNNQESTVSGPNAKIYKTTDGGLNWLEQSGGLPLADMGRIGLAISETEANTVYALYVNTASHFEDIYKTIDGGQTWSSVIDANNANPFGGDPLGGFGWYFGKINLNPDVPGEIFLQGVRLWKSTDDGLSWQRAIPPTSTYSIHVDKHDLAFAGSDTILVATDGGLYKGTLNQTVWEDIESIPATQFYRVAYNPHIPANYYGGTQDNGSVGGNNTSEEWARLQGGDGFQMIFNPNDSNIVWTETQNGVLYVTENGVSAGFWSYGGSGIDSDDRRNWDMPIIMSPHNPDILFTGTYRVYINTSGASPQWEAISEDVTDGLIFSNRFHTITTIHESPVEEGLLYVGTTDGNVWRTDFIGGDWFNISDGIPKRYITDIKASPSDADRVFVSVSGYKYNDFNPHIFRSDDRGETWFNISGDLPNLAINDIYILPNHFDEVVFAATDGGVYATINSGEDWERLGNNMPIIPVYDLEWNEINNELVAGTHARSIMTFPLDSILLDPVATTSISRQADQIKLYPSPTVSEISIDIKEADLFSDFEFTIINTEGRVVLRQNRNELTKINVSQLESGIYFIKIRQSNKEWTGRFVVNGL